jgi:hypothetical protein
MAAIKYTLSRDTSRRAPSIEAEAQWLREEGFLWYPLNVKPQRARIGDWVYFIRDGSMVARARITARSPNDASEFFTTYTGQKVETSCFQIQVKQMELARLPIPHKGFQGFRYVTAKELPAFERAFITPIKNQHADSLHRIS